MTILLSTYGTHGDVAPYVAIARELQMVGARPIIATATAYREMIEGAGIEWKHCPPETPGAADFARVMNAARGDERVLRELVLPALRQSVDALDLLARDADVIVSHTLAFAGPIVAAKRQLPWISATVSPLALFEPALAPALPIAPWAANHPRFNAILLGLLRRQFGVWLRPVQQLRVEMGLAPGENALWEGAHSPLLALRLWSPLFCQPNAGVTTGFCFLDDVAPLAPALENWLHEGTPPVVICAASGCGDARWLRQIALSARDMGRRTLVLGADATAYADADPNILALSFAPLQRVLPHAAALVHGGGIGTLALGWRAGVPMLILPRAHDQFDNARRAQRLGIARLESIGVWKSFLANESLKARVTQSGALIAREEGALKAARAILNAGSLACP